MFTFCVKMENKNTLDVVQLFYVKLCTSITRSSQLSTCGLIRKQKGNFSACGDFSFPLQLKYWLKYLQRSELCRDNSLGTSFVSNIEKSCPMTVLEYCYLNRVQDADCQDHAAISDFEWVIQNLVENSKSWVLPISKCTVQHDRVQIYLDRKLAFKCVLQIVLSQKNMYGQSPTKQKAFVLTSDRLQEDVCKMNLSELRVDLLRRTTIKLLEATGHEVLDVRDCISEKPITFLHFSTKSSAIAPEHQRVLCGVVVNSRHHSKEICVTAQDYIRWRCRDMKMMAMHKYEDISQSETESDDFLSKLGEAAVRIDLLHVKPSHTVSLSLDTNISGSRETSSRGAAFILYNCARLAAVLRQFEEKVQLRYYPCLIPYEEVDFSLLNKEEEWDLVFGYIMSYPSVLQSSVLNVEKGRISPNLLCSFISAMCSCFSVYYRRIRILTEPRSQLLPVMFARLYLLQCIQQVLHNALNLLGITPVIQM